MHGPGLIVAERGETDKNVSAEVDGFSLLNFGAFARPRAGHGRGSLSLLREGKNSKGGVVRARTAVYADAGRIEPR